MHGGFPVSSLPERPNLDHLRKQAKELLRQHRAGDPAAMARVRRYLPAAKDKNDVELSAMSLQLRDAQSCISRQYGFPSWHELKDYVEWKISSATGGRELSHWLRLMYSGDVTGGQGRAQPTLAMRVLAAPDEVYVGACTSKPAAA
jgi:hypothetical protein